MTYQYAVKFVCGYSNGVEVARGRYFTAINVHNPNQHDAELRKKFALPGPEPQQPGDFTQFYTDNLKPDQVLEIDCRDIRSKTNSISSAVFRKGFVLIECELELDVVAVYTSGSLFGFFRALHVEHVQPRPLP